MFSLLLNHWGLQLFVCFLFICFYLIKKSCSFFFMLLIVLWNCNFLLIKEIRIRDILQDWLLNSFWSCVVLLANLLVMLRDPVSVKLHIIGLMISHWLINMACIIVVSLTQYIALESFQIVLTYWGFAMFLLGTPSTTTTTATPAPTLYHLQVVSLYKKGRGDHSQRTFSKGQAGFGIGPANQGQLLCLVQHFLSAVIRTK